MVEFIHTLSQLFGLPAVVFWTSSFGFWQQTIVVFNRYESELPKFHGFTKPWFHRESSSGKKKLPTMLYTGVYSF